MFHIILNACPYDCMGSRTKPYHADSLADALEMISHIYIDNLCFVEEIADLYCYDEDSIQEAIEEDACLPVFLLIEVFEYDGYIYEMPIDCFENFEYNRWNDDFNECGSIYEAIDGLSLKKHFSIDLDYEFTGDVNTQHRENILAVKKAIAELSRNGALL